MRSEGREEVWKFAEEFGSKPRLVSSSWSRIY